MAHPTFLSIPLKKTWEVDLIKPLMSFINETYSSDPNKEEYSSNLIELNKLRNNALMKTVDKSESGLETLYKYCDQLIALEPKMPISENQIRISFKWQDAFDKDALFVAKKIMSITSGLFEKVSVLFNVAALQSQIAEQQNMTNDENLKLAAKLFQLSSGILAHLKAISPSAVHAEGGCDLNPDVLNALSSIMLAQAQDCFVRKAINDKMKPAVVAKIASQCSDFYSDANKLMLLDSIKNYWPKDWVNIVASRQSGYNAICQFYQSQVAKEMKEFGEEIARLRLSKDAMLACEMRSGITFSFTEMKNRIQKSLTEAEKDNDFIYHARVPDASSLQPVGKALLAKPTALPGVMSKNFRDLFANLMPLAAQNAVSMYEQRKSGLINMEVGRMRESTQLLNSVLASLNLPAALEDSEGVSVPPSLLAKSAAIREMGGFPVLMKLINELPLLLQRNKEILDESEKMLQEEQSSDDQLRAQFREKWTRTPSSQLTETILSEAAKYRTIITNAINADSIVRDRFNQHRENIELLSKSPQEIESILPSSDMGNGNAGSQAAHQLRNIINQLEEIKSKRDGLENSLKQASASDNMAQQFLAALSADGALNEEAISTEHLEKMFSSLREEVQQGISQQEVLLQQLQTANSTFVEGRQSSNMTLKRDDKLKMMAVAHDSFMELKSNLEEGTKFYNDLTEILIKFQNKSSDFCFARKTEKEELMKDLSAGIARQSYTPTPPAPSYQKPTENNEKNNDNSSERPARPPPPKVKSESAAPSPAPRTNIPPNPQSYPTGYQPYPQQPPVAPYPQQYNTMPMPQYAPPMPGGYNPYFQNYPPQQGPNNYPPYYPNQQPGYPPNYQYPPQGYGTYPPPR